MKTGIHTLFYLTAALALATSCADDDLVAPEGNPDAIKFSADMAPVVVQSRSTDTLDCAAYVDSLPEPRVVAFTMGADSVGMLLTVTHNDTNPFAAGDSVSSRGQSMPVGDVAPVVSVWKNTQQYFSYNKTVTLTRTPYNTGYNWPFGESVSVFAWAEGNSINKGNHLSADGCSLTATRNGDSHNFSFTINHRVGGNNGGWRDAEYQGDYVFAVAKNRTRNQNNGVIDLRFRHAMSAITFKIGTMPTDVRVKQIALRGMYHSGTCVINGEGDDISFAWQNLGTISDTWQRLGDTASDRDNQTPSTKPATPGTIITPEDQQMVFFMIPQDLPGDASITFDYVIADAERSYTARLSDFGITKILPDHYYTITIGLLDEVTIDVTDSNHVTYKDNLAITNTGRVPGYIRATITGYWADYRGRVTHAWDANADGWFDGFVGPNWQQGADGYYYYMYVVPPGWVTDKLFNSYTLRDGRYPEETLHLNIVGQIVHRYYRGDANNPGYNEWTSRGNIYPNTNHK